MNGVPSNKFSRAYESVVTAIDELKELNQQPESRSRELSIAITEMETGLLWLLQSPGNVNDTEGAQR